MDESIAEIEKKINRWTRQRRRFFRRQSKEVTEKGKEFLDKLDKLLTEQQRDIEKRHRQFIHWLKTKQWTWDDVRQTLVRSIATTTLAGTLLLTPLTASSSTDVRAPPGRMRLLFSDQEFQSMAKEKARQALAQILPKLDHQLTPGEEQTMTLLLAKILPVAAVAELDGNRLNTTWGWMGGEQHLYRYPGDSLAEHMVTRADWEKYYRGGSAEEVGRISTSGIAPGLGAWGYFASSKAAMTEQDVLRERWYIAAQTFLAPGWNERTQELYDWFRYRKMLVVNQKTGQAVVGVIGDAGPAEFTGKKSGGSPEVMEALGIGHGPRKGPVIMLFLDDPNDTIPLGPIDLGVKIEKGGA